jgi:hypothetical protein
VVVPQNKELLLPAISAQGLVKIYDARLLQGEGQLIMANDVSGRVN